MWEGFSKFRGVGFGMQGCSGAVKKRFRAWQDAKSFLLRLRGSSLSEACTNCAEALVQGVVDSYVSVQPWRVQGAGAG